MGKLEIITENDPLDRELGFLPVDQMSTDEKIDQILSLQREIAKAIYQLSNNPMFAAMGMQNTFGKR